MNTNVESRYRNLSENETFPNFHFRVFNDISCDHPFYEIYNTFFANTIRNYNHN